MQLVMRDARPDGRDEQARSDLPCALSLPPAASLLKRSTTSLGDITELEVAAALARNGMKLLRPLSSATRYDLLIDNEDGTFTRVQCKTGRLRHGRVEFAMYSVSGHNTRSNRYHGQIDAFGVHCPHNGETYLIPIEALAARGSVGYLRVLPAKNGQRRRIRQARPYLIGRTEPVPSAYPVGTELFRDEGEDNACS